MVFSTIGRVSPLPAAALGDSDGVFSNPAITAVMQGYGFYRFPEISAGSSIYTIGAGPIHPVYIKREDLFLRVGFQPEGQ